MTAKKTRDKNTLYARMLSDDLTESERQHLKDSGTWSEIERIIQIMDEVELPSFNKQEGFNVLKEALPTKSKGKIIRLKRWARIGVAASILTFISIFLFKSLDSSTSISSKYGNTGTFHFFDSSSVILNDGSEIRFDEKKWDKKREIQLKGEAFFKVAKGSPFVVNTRMGSIEVLGTSFNIRARENNLYVTCYSGKVKVISNHQEFILSKGEEVKVSEGTTIKGEKSFHEDKTPSWLNNVSSFKEENINNVFDEIERQFNISITAPKIDNKFTGSFTHNSLEESLYQVCTPMGLKFKIDSNTTRVFIMK